MNLLTHLSDYVLWSPTKLGLKNVVKYFLQGHSNFQRSAVSRGTYQIRLAKLVVKMHLQNIRILNAPAERSISHYCEVTLT